MLIHKVALIAGALVISGAATMAQAHDQVGSSAESIVSDAYNNQRALQDRGQNDAYLAQFRGRPAMVASSGLITQRDALDIARAQGISDVQGVQERGGVWMVDGTNFFGGNLTVHVNARGQVLDVQRG
ncbi:hypothetical protein DWF00_04035 [Bosea caraganae]|uniref:PepSY domain-containing protein n=1 Tax=Bosea caraganae TaxID=2763117 RepID=A0A370L5K8_9HYPH|nr:hypothetical protein [Bosea caraganae]RDJ24258.1 hypothetical protein DWE98_15265 [Bosea caraganae]RDJ30300.1 hypothetical protein DWF00_04035 [Bosea caraganae]